MLSGRIHKAVMAGGLIFREMSLCRNRYWPACSPVPCASAVADEIVIVHSTGTGLHDVAATIATCRQSLDAGAGTQFTFS